HVDDPPLHVELLHGSDEAEKRQPEEVVLARFRSRRDDVADPQLRLGACAVAAREQIRRNEQRRESDRCGSHCSATLAPWTRRASTAVRPTSSSRSRPASICTATSALAARPQRPCQSTTVMPRVSEPSSSTST